MVTEKLIHIRIRVPEKMLKKLRDKAEDNMRSLNAEALHVFRNYLKLPLATINQTETNARKSPTKR